MLVGHVWSMSDVLSLYFVAILNWRNKVDFMVFYLLLNGKYAQWPAMCARYASVAGVMCIRVGGLVYV